MQSQNRPLAVKHGFMLQNFTVSIKSMNSNTFKLHRLSGKLHPLALLKHIMQNKTCLSPENFAKIFNEALYISTLFDWTIRSAPNVGRYCKCTTTIHSQMTSVSVLLALVLPFLRKKDKKCISNVKSGVRQTIKETAKQRNITDIKRALNGCTHETVFLTFQKAQREYCHCTAGSSWNWICDCRRSGGKLF